MSVDVDWEYEDITLERVRFLGSVLHLSAFSVSVSVVPFICMSLSCNGRRDARAHRSLAIDRDCKANSPAESCQIVNP